MDMYNNQDIEIYPDDTDQIRRMKTLLQEQRRDTTYTWTAEKRWAGPNPIWVVYQTLIVDGHPLPPHMERGKNAFSGVDGARKALAYLEYQQEAGIDPVMIPRQLKQEARA